MADQNSNSFDLLLNGVLGELPAEQAVELDRQLAADATLRDQFARLTGLLTSLREIARDPIQVRKALIEQAKRLFELRPMSAPAGFSDGIDALVIDLLEDSREQDVLAGFRGATAAYQLTFESEDVEVHLQITTPEPDAAEIEIRGQIEVETDDSVGRIVFRSIPDGQDFEATTPDEFGQFKISLRPGTYDLWIEIGNRSVVMTAIEVG